MTTKQTHKQIHERLRSERAEAEHGAGLLLEEQERAPAEGSDDFERDRPIIGMPLPVQQGEHGLILLADAIGAWAVERMSARLLLLPLWPFPPHRHLYQSLWPLMQAIDGLFLPAGLQGSDWYTLWKTSRQQPDPAGWPLCWELALAQLATVIGMPLLAVGDGAEKWNSALGGKRGNRPGNQLGADGRDGGDGGEERDDPLKGAASPARTAHAAAAPPLSPDAWERHRLRVRAHSTLACVLQAALARQTGEQQPWELAFLPQQAIERLAPGLRSCAQSEAGTVVGFERGDGLFGVGMLGRLDWGLDQLYGATLFEAFVQACRAFDHTWRQTGAAWEEARDVICTTVAELVAQGQPLIPATEQAHQAPHIRHLSSPLSSPHPPHPRPHFHPHPQSSAVPQVSPQASSDASVLTQRAMGRRSSRQRFPLPTKEERIRSRWYRLRGTRQVMPALAAHTDQPDRGASQTLRTGTDSIQRRRKTLRTPHEQQKRHERHE
ncbi:MAG: hypothetical protein IMW89_13960 [Ktedonobacteraceae bacterium]|nr:hypothetical protein [Ktedonobacteraceae bacterium]